MRGSIYRRGEAWTVKIERPRRADGRRQYRYETVATRREAERLRAKLVHDLDAGTYIEPCDLFVREHLHEWLNYVSTRLSARTVERYPESSRAIWSRASVRSVLVDLRPLDISRLLRPRACPRSPSGGAPLARATLVKFPTSLHGRSRTRSPGSASPVKPGGSRDGAQRRRSSPAPRRAR